MHKVTTRVYYADTDALGVVYHANYLKFFELARIESLRMLGIELPTFTEQYGVQFVVVNANINYHKPARFNDMLTVTSRIDKIGNASLTYSQNIYIADKDILLCSALIKLVTVDKHMRPRAVPDILRKGIINDH